jgi:geranylgeranyl diphosphate synthase, type I
MNDEEYFLSTYKNAALSVVEEVKKFQTNMVTTFPETDPLRQETIRFVRDGGKRFRPALSYLVSKYYDVDYLFPHIALETFHKYLLTHDDIIDRDRIRYGHPTVHTQLETILTSQEHTSYGEKNDFDSQSIHFGNSLGMIAGDLMDATTYKIIFSSDLEDSVKVKLGSLVVTAVEEVVWGWYDQFLMDYLPLSSSQLSYERIEKSIVWVTGKYTMSFPLRYGFAVAGVPMPDGLEHLADDLGVLFQTGDDLIGLFGDPEVTQKSNYGDIIQGKKTLPMWFTYTGASDSDKKTLEQLVGSKDLTSSEADTVRDIVVNSGGLEKTKTLMREYRDACLGQIDGLDIPHELKSFLRGFAVYLEKREF